MRVGGRVASYGERGPRGKGDSVDRRRGGSSLDRVGVRRRRSPSRRRTVIATAIGALASAIVVVGNPTGVASAFTQMQGWTIECTGTTLSVTLPDPIVPTQGDVLNLFQLRFTPGPEPFDVYSATATLNGQVASVSLADLQANQGFASGTGFTVDAKNWGVSYDKAGATYFTLNAITTVVENGVRKCVEATGPPSVPMDGNWSVSCTASTLTVTHSQAFFSGGTPTATLFTSMVGDRLNGITPISSVIVSGNGRTLTMSVPPSLTGDDVPPYGTRLTGVAVTVGDTAYARSDAIVLFADANGTVSCAPPTAALTVSVVNQAGEPVTNASVYAVPIQQCGGVGGARLLGNRGAGEHQAYVGQLPTGYYWIGVVAPEGYASQWYDNAPCEAATPVLAAADGSVNPSSLTVTLVAGRTATIDVVDDDGNAVPNACATAYSWAPGAGWGVWIGSDCTQDGGSSISVPGISVNGPITMMINAPGFLNTFIGARTFAETVGFTVDADGSFTSVRGDDVSRTVVMKPSAQIVGFVKTAEGSGVPDVCVLAVDIVNDFGGSSCTNGNGRYSLDVDPDRLYRLRFDGSNAGLSREYYGGEKDGQAVFAASWDTSTLVGAGTLPDVTLPAASLITVNVVGADGRPVQDACVNAWSDDGSGQYWQWANSACNAYNGVYRVGGLKDRVTGYKISVDAPGYRTSWSGGAFSRISAAVVQTEDTLNIQLTAGTALNMVVQDESGHPIEACVDAFAVTSNRGWGEYVGTGCSRADGVTVRGLAPASQVALRVNSIRGEYASAWVTGSANSLLAGDFDERTIFTLPNTGTLSIGSVRLQPAVQLSGTIQVDGTPAGGICADAIDVPDGGAAWAFLGRGCSDPTGRYTIRGLPSIATATTRVLFTNPQGDGIPAWFVAGESSGTPDFPSATAVATQASPSGIDINLRVGNGVDVTVERADGSPARNVCVGAITGTWRLAAGGCAGESGRLRLRGLADDMYRLWLQSPDGQFVSGLARDDSDQPVTITTPTDLSVTLTAREARTVTGVVRLDGTPIDGACVIAVGGATGTANPLSCTDSSGSYTITSLDPNTVYTFKVVDARVPSRFESSVVELGPGGGDIAVSSPPASDALGEGAQAAISSMTSLHSMAFGGGSAVTVTGRTASSVSLAWATELPGPFTVEATVGGVEVFSGVSDTADLTILGLVTNVSYQITVSAGATTIGSLHVELVDSPPDTPRQPVIDEVEGSSISISWPEVASSGSPVSYVAYAFDAFGSLVAETTSTGPSAQFSDLARPASYVFQVVAVNRVGGSSRSPASLPVQLTGSAPTSPSNVRASVVLGGIRVLWDPTSDTGGGTDLRYVVSLEPDDAPPCDTDETTCTFEGLTAGTTYTVSVRAYSTTGTSSAGSTSIRYPRSGGGGGGDTPEPTRQLTVEREGDGRGRVLSTPAGIACGTDCTEQFPEGASVTLTATPRKGNAFTGWSGDACSGTDPTCTVTLTADIRVTATFQPIYDVAVTKKGRGNGRVRSAPAGIACGTDCTEGFVGGTTVTLTAKPGKRSTFKGWSGDACTGTSRTCTFTVSEATTVSARFGRPPRTRHAPARAAPPSTRVR